MHSACCVAGLSYMCCARRRGGCTDLDTLPCCEPCSAHTKSLAHTRNFVCLDVIQLLICLGIHQAVNCLSHADIPSRASDHLLGHQTTLQC
jgi:hypothetical protein